MGDGISLREVFKILGKYKMVVLSITIVFGLITGIVSYYVLPSIYESTTQILVNQNNKQNNEMSNQNFETNLQFVDTYSDIIQNPGILNQVSKQLDLNFTAKQMNKKITVTSNDNSQVINISVRDSNIERATSIANTTVEVFSEEVKELLNVNNVSVISPAAIVDDPLPVGPNVLLNTVIASLIGLLFGISWAFLLNYMNTTIKDDQDVEDLLNIPVLAMIPTLIVERAKPKEIVEKIYERKEVL